MTYTTALVTFIDVLGFRELVKNDPSGDAVLKVVSQLRRFGTEDLSGEGKARGAAAIHFSDSVSRCTPLVGGAGWRSDRKTLLHELEELTYIQGELAAEGILLRGGIASGLVLSDPKGNGIFGPALIDAYMLESRHAQYPRIVLHPALLELHAISRENGLGIYAEDGVLLTRASEDGFYFVDYLRNFPREVHEDPSPYREEYCRSYIVPRKQRIEEGLAQKEVLSSERTKYAWLARYHDEVAREILGEHATDVLIAGCVPR